MQIRISLSRQRLCLEEGGSEVGCYSVSTALNGAGERSGSGGTPRGMHHIRIKIGAGCAENTVFVGRRASGEIYTPQLAADQPERDWILTRILWLTGDEPESNRGGEVDTLRRMIYIHGTPESEPMGVARSHGCIRMHNRDLIPLFERVSVGTRVVIEE